MQKLIFANWKSQKLQNQVEPWFTSVGAPPAGVQLVVMPSTTLLSASAAHLSTGVSLGAQNVSQFPIGAYTGEVAAAQLADLGVTHCLVGHSERRQYFGETNDTVVKKSEQLQLSMVTPVVCVDEPYIESQYAALQAAGIHTFVLAYEPVAAIGTGKNVSLEQVTKIREMAKKLGDTPFVYGGSVSVENVAEYVLICDGVLIGSASLDGQEFSRVLTIAAGEEPSFA